MTRSQEEVDLVRGLLEAGESQASISRTTGISRAAIRDWQRNGFTSKKPRSVSCTPCAWIAKVPAEPYAYLLGMYLGDGCISKTHRAGVFALRIACDLKYPGIIDECGAAMAAVLPNRVCHGPSVGCLFVTSTSKHWPCLFPQHGPGRKHERLIQLHPWQRDIALDRDPRMFLRGLMHSDGCRCLNRVKNKVGQRYEYPRYMFRNVSTDIHGLFAEACRQVGVECRWTNARTMAVSRAADVALLDEFIGPKT